MSLVVNQTISKLVWAEMADRYDVTVNPRRTQRAKKIIGAIADLLGIVDKDDFVKNFCITLHEVMLLNFTPGAAKPDPLRQLANCAHEFTHVRQQDRDGSFFVSYTFSEQYRAIQETKAFKAGMFTTYAIDGTYRSPRDYANQLIQYRISRRLRRSVEVALEKTIPHLSNLDLAPKAAQQVVSLIKKRQPVKPQELKHTLTSRRMTK